MKPFLAALALMLLAAPAWATVTTPTYSVSFTCTGSIGPFPFVFPISDPTAMTVTQNGTLVPSTSYSIVPVNNNYDNGGSVTLNAVCPAGQPLVLTRMTPVTQTSIYADNMPTPMMTIGNGLDKLTEIIQETNGDFDLPIYLANGSTCVTQPVGDASNKCATDQFVIQNQTGANIAPQTITSSVNSVINIAAPPYNAVGDCTPTGSNATCTNNTAAIQAAINHAVALGSAIFVPANSPNVANPTVYYVAGTLNPKGVSIYGPPGAGEGLIYSSVMIRGAQGLDVFASGDPSTPGFVSSSGGMSWHDFGIDIDDSADVSATIAGGHRKPGKTCPDVLATNSSAVVSSTQCEFSYGDVGQNISLTDGTHTLTTTIASIGSLAGNPFSTTATLAAEWAYATHANSTMYVAIMGQSLAQRVGNCALALDDTATTDLAGLFNAKFENLTIATTSGASQNNSCAFFFQGENGNPYMTHWSQVFSRTDWGYLFVESDGLAAGVLNAAIGDKNTLNQLFVENNKPWVSYDGGQNVLSNDQWAGSLFGLQILNYGGNEAYATGWVVTAMEFADSPTLNYGFRIDGDQQNFTEAEISYPSTIPSFWGASASSCSFCGVPGNVTITGNNNYFSFSDGSASSHITDRGTGNQCSIGISGSPNDGGLQPALRQSCSIYNSRQGNAFAHTAESTDGNQLNPYNNRTDLDIFPVDLQNSGLAQPVQDSTSETGWYVQVPAGDAYLVSSINQGLPIVGLNLFGPNLPATKIDLCAEMRTDTETGAGAVQIWLNNSYYAQVSSSGVSTTWTTYCQYGIDLTSQSAATVEYALSATTHNVRFGHITINPWKDSVNVVGQMQSASYLGTVAGAPSGSCPTNGQFEMTQDGAISWCDSGTWTAFSGGSGLFNALSGDATSTSTGGATEVVGLLTKALPSLAAGCIFSASSSGPWSFVPCGGGTANSVLVTQLTSGSSGYWNILGVQCTLGAQCIPATGASTVAPRYSPSTGFLDLPNGFTINGAAGTVGQALYSNGTSGYVPGTLARPWSCELNWGGINGTPIAAATYNGQCRNNTGKTVTITGVSCYIDAGSSSTLNASAHTLGSLLTGAVTCSTSYANGTQTSNVLLTSGDYITFTAVADGTATLIDGYVKGTYPQ